jgi:hypothetical protein
MKFIGNYYVRTLADEETNLLKYVEKLSIKNNTN